MSQRKKGSRSCFKRGGKPPCSGREELKLAGRAGRDTTETRAPKPDESVTIRPLAWHPSNAS